MGSCFSSSESSSSTSLKTSRDISSKIPTNENTSLLLNSFMNKIHEINVEEEFDSLINETKKFNILVVCDFYAVWCAPCLQIAPVLYKWASNDYKTNVIFIKIDVDKNNDLADKFSIRVLPTFVLFKQGKEIYRSIGADTMNLKREIDKLK